ncbi:MAG: branched-chain amino acid transport system II carrier protein [Gammaproteobacteria bacterium]
MNKKLIITSGLALFAMFFGAGNIIYPLSLGAKAGDHIPYVIAAFLISGIGLPFLGLFATSLYHGDYWAFFRRLGKVPAFLLITFLILIIGPLFAIPRTETITFHTLETFLPGILRNPYVFSGLYCSILYLLTCRESKVIDIIGKILSPIKLSLFGILIVAGLVGSHTIPVNPNPISVSIKSGLYDGYSTMDLLAAFFFCTAIYNNIVLKAKASGATNNKTFIKIFFKSCLLGAFLLSIVYIGFMLLALCHASQLQGVDTAQMIVAISNLVLGRIGSLFVGICVAFACIVTAMALTEVTTAFFHEHVLLNKVPHNVCLIIVIISIYAMSIVGFAGIMKISLPILVVLYPALIVYCIINICCSFFCMKHQSQLKSV